MAISNLIELKNRPLNSESFSAFFAAIPIPSFAFVGEELVLIDFNDAIEKLSFEGVSLGIKASELFKDDGRILTNLFSCLHEKSNFSEECEYRMKKTGEQKKFFTSFIFIQPDLVILHIEDLTRQNKVNKALQEARDVLTGLQLILNQSPAVVFLVRDEEGWPVEYITDNIRQFGYEPSDFYSHMLKFTDIIHPEDLGNVITETRLKCQNSVTEFVQEYRIVSKLGEYRWINVRTWIKRNRENQITHFQGIILDITERRVMEDILKESDEKWRDLSENSPAHVLLLDREHKIIYINRTVPDLSKEEVIGTSIYDYTPQEFHKVSRDIYNSVWETGESRSFHTYYKTKEGDIRYFDVWIGPVTQSGKVVALVSHGMDVTKRKKAEQEIKESEEKFRALFENTNDAIFILDKNSQFIEVNQTACERLGYSREELLKLAPESIIPPGYKIDIQGNIKTLEEKGELMIEAEIMTKDRNIFPVEISSRIFNFGGKNRIISVARDITERKVVEQELKKSEHNFKERVKELTCLYGLSRLFEKPGISIDEIIQGTFVLISSAMQFPEVICTRIIFNEKEYKTINFKETKWEITSKVKFKGKQVKIEVYYLEENLFLKEERSLLHEIVNRLKSIIEYKIITEELVRKEKLATIGTLIGSIGHELRNPLGVISNSVYFLNQKMKKKEEKVEKHLKILQKEVDKANKFISNLLDFIRIRTPNFKEGDLNKTIENVANEMIFPENIILERYLDDKLPSINFDFSQIKQVFHNLFLNAIQAMPEGGILEITTSSRENFIEIRIKDSGIGISEEDLDNIFEPLYTTKVIGIGLGLTIVKDLVEKHGGIIQVKRNSRGGTIFTLKLPLKEVKL